MSDGAPSPLDARQPYIEWLGELNTLVVELSLECHPEDKYNDFRDYAGDVLARMPNTAVEEIASSELLAIVAALDELRSHLRAFCATLEGQHSFDDGELSEAFRQLMRAGKRLHLELQRQLRDWRTS